MARKCKKCKEGAPDWLVTYGDMVTLLLCFFVLLLIFMQPKKRIPRLEVLEKIQERFGMTGTPGRVPIEALPTQSMIPREETITLYRMKKNAPRSDETPTQEEQTRPKITPPDKMTVIRGDLYFAPEKTELRNEVLEEINIIVDRIKGHNTIIHIRGHAARAEFNGQVNESDKRVELSYLRAIAVMRALEDRGVDPKKLRVIAVGDREPITQEDYTEGVRRVNRRVEVVWTGMNNKDRERVFLK